MSFIPTGDQSVFNMASATFPRARAREACVRVCARHTSGRGGGGGRGGGRGRVRAGRAPPHVQPLARAPLVRAGAARGRGARARRPRERKRKRRGARAHTEGGGAGAARAAGAHGAWLARACPGGRGHQGAEGGRTLARLERSRLWCHALTRARAGGGGAHAARADRRGDDAHVAAAPDRLLHLRGPGHRLLAHVEHVRVEFRRDALRGDVHVRQHPVHQLNGLPHGTGQPGARGPRRQTHMRALAQTRAHARSWTRACASARAQAHMRAYLCAVLRADASAHPRGFREG